MGRTAAVSLVRVTEGWLLLTGTTTTLFAGTVSPWLVARQGYRKERKLVEDGLRRMTCQELLVALQKLRVKALRLVQAPTTKFEAPDDDEWLWLRAKIDTTVSREMRQQIGRTFELLIRLEASMDAVQQSVRKDGASAPTDLMARLIEDSEALDTDIRKIRKLSREELDQDGRLDSIRRRLR